MLNGMYGGEKNYIFSKKRGLEELILSTPSIMIVAVATCYYALGSSSLLTMLMKPANNSAMSV